MEKYELIRSNRKTIAIQIRGDGQVIVRAPLRMSNAAIQQFIAQKEGWIARHLVSLQQRQVFSEPAFTAAELPTTPEKTSLAVLPVLPRLWE